MAILVQQSEATAEYRRMYFHCVDATDGMTPETGEADGQPQISLNGAGWGNTTNVLVAMGNGRYYVELVAATEVNSLGIIEGRYKSANTAESIGTTLQVVPFDPYDAIPTAAGIADAVWDEVLTVATHNVGYSAGQRLRLLILDGATARAGSTSTTIKLAASASATNNIYNGNIVSIVGNTGAGQTRLVIEYKGGEDKEAIIDRLWDIIPDETSIYELLPFNEILLATHGTAVAATANTITLASNALAIAHSYVGCLIYISARTGAGQSRLIFAYTAEREASISPNWETIPDNTSVYKVIPVGRSIVETVNDKTGYSLAVSPALASVCTEARLANLDATISSRSTLTAVGVWSYATRTLSSFGTLISGIWSYVTRTLTGATNITSDGNTIDQTKIVKLDATISSRLATSGYTAPDNASIADIKTKVDSLPSIGTGAIAFVYTLTNSEDDLPIADADVWVTTDVTGNDVIASGSTDQNGQVIFYLDAGTVYVWRQKSGWNFTNPDVEVVS